MLMIDWPKAKSHLVLRAYVKGRYYAHNLIGWDDVLPIRIRKRRDCVHLGSKYGGWVVPTELLGPDSICYLVGCGDDITFDLALIERFGCHVHAFDPTPKAISHVEQTVPGNPLYHFYPVGLWDQATDLKLYIPCEESNPSFSALNLQRTDDYILAPVDRLSNLMAKLGHEKLDLLKIDIEGAEYKVVQSIIDDALDIRVLCVEYDEYFRPLDSGYRKRISESVQGLRKAGFSLVFSQGKCNYTFVKTV